VVLESFKADQAQPMQGLFAPLGRCDAANCQRKLNVAQSSEPGKQIAILGHVTDVGVQTKDWSTLVEDGAIRCSEQARGKTQQSGLAATRRTYDRRNLFGRNVEADAVEGKYVLVLTSKRKPNIREMYRGRFRWVICPVHQADPVRRFSALPYVHPLQLRSIADDPPRSGAPCQLRNLFVQSSPSRLGIADEIILSSTATLMLFSHIVVVIRPPRG
jgi:hypothetical protein